ncbi:hypothetical protein WMF26_21470 [Sorangium sp. So ce185]|uniref:hypothetical protein n=1 Tax=Sorangium sp. So ce185 TaxID=3133287 RepID=UPI003F601817
MRATERTSSKAVSNASPPPSGGAQAEIGAPSRRAARRRRLGIPFLWTLPAASAVVALQLVGCWPLSYSEDCEDDARYCPPAATGTGGNAPDPTCDPDPTQDASTVTERCAVFARADAASDGNGTKARPYASLAEAIANANGKRVLACSSGVFEESVTVKAPVEVIGGFDCTADWAWSEQARSAIEGSADEVALTLAEDAGGVKVQGFTIRAADATKPGGSSIGVAVAGIEAELVRVDVIAGDARDGASGETSAAAQNGASAPADVSHACVIAVYGGLPGKTTCDDGETSGGVGGLGGKPEEDEGRGQNGQTGTPQVDPSTEDGIGGVGHGQPGASIDCRSGEPGARGATGGAGTGGSDTTLQLASIAGGDGGKGVNGARGQGGGGGGGAKAGQFCSLGGGSFTDGAGASGGGGGAGGCGGRGGAGGKAGGSSIAILSLGTQLALTDVTVAVGKAGNGGAGGDGSPGGAGGTGADGGNRVTASGSIEGCPGGKGGAGGDGGPGGGGRGGHAVGIAYKVTPTPAPAEVPFDGGPAGGGGRSGFGGGDSNAGAPGVSGACWDFATNTSCAPQ